MCLKHKIFRDLMFNVFEEKQTILVVVYWLWYNFSNINMNDDN